METITQPNLFKGFRYFENLLPSFAKTGLFSPGAQQYTREQAGQRTAGYRPRAEVLARRDETADTISLGLLPPTGYPAFEPGQHIHVAMEIHGVRHVRQYSLTGSAKDRVLSITVKRAQNGKVSQYLHNHIHAGAELEISVPRGEFAMPETNQAAYLFFSAGSGITPIYAIVRALLEQGAQGDVYFFHAAKNPESVIFRSDLKRFAAEYDNFHLHFFYSEGAASNRLSVSSAMVQLQNAAVSERTRTIYPLQTPVRICGAGDFVQSIEADLTALPVLFGNVTANLMRNIWAHAIIFCGHFTADAEAFSEAETQNESRGAWYLRQLKGSSNLTGNWWFHILTGNLSHQIEHHLFPDIPAWRYGQMPPRVQEICMKYGQNYNTGSFTKQYGEVLRRIFRYSLPDSWFTAA